MRFKTKKNTKTVEISTASLPDIVFLLLFFFMVSATIRPHDQIVNTKLPIAQSVTKVEKKDLIKELQIGIPKNNVYGSDPKVSAAGRFLTVDDITSWAISERESLPEAYQDQMIVMIRADEKVSMGMIVDIQERLRGVDARKVLFRTMEE